MSENIKKIQAGLNGIIDGKAKFGFAKEYAHILIFANPVHSLLYTIPYNAFLYTALSWINALCYIASLIGLLGCFAKNDFKKIGIYFILSAAPSIINLFKGYSFNISSLIYIAFYIFLAVCSLRYSGEDLPYTTVNVPQPTQPLNNEVKEKKCSKCGSVLKPNASFCASCGAKVE